MDDIEQKYKKFFIDQNMSELFSNYTVEIEDSSYKDTSFVTKTIVIDHARRHTRSRGIKNA